jgi:hypothetical protein
LPGPTRRRKIECDRQCRQALGHNPRTRRRAHGRKRRHLLAPPPSQRAMVRGRRGRGNARSLRQRPLPLALSALTSPSGPISRDSNELPRMYRSVSTILNPRHYVELRPLHSTPVRKASKRLLNARSPERPQAIAPPSHPPRARTATASAKSRRPGAPETQPRKREAR